MGSRLRRVYDRPQTPLERVLAGPEADAVKTAQLQTLRERLDPFAISQAIDQKLDRLFALAHPRPTPRAKPSPRALTAVERQAVHAISARLGIPVFMGPGRPVSPRRK